jgi:hypothetical protein
VKYLAIALLAVAACGSKSSAPKGMAPEVSGLAAVPATAEVVLAADIGKLSGSPVIERAVDQLLLRDPTLAASWQRVKDSCKLDIGKQVKHVMLAIGPAAGPQVGSGPVLMVVTGSLPENDLAACVRTMVGQGGGTLTAKPSDGRTLYLAKDGNRTMYFAYGKPDTVVLGSNEAFVTEALGKGKKAQDNPQLMRWLAIVDQTAGFWAAGRVPERVRQGLVKNTEGKVATGPVAFVASGNLQQGADVTLGVVMSSPEDAKTLYSYANQEIGLLTAVAQMKSLGAIVGKLSIVAEKEIVRFHAALTVDDLNQLLSALDGGAPPAQDSPPAPPGPGSGSDSK